MERQELIGLIDYTALKAVTNWEDIQNLCREAVRHHTASVCIPPSYLERVKKEFPELTLCTVIGFPLGYNTAACKVFEAEDAVRRGADEVDMVINLGDVKNGEFDKVKDEIAAVRKAAGGKILKVIVETCYLTEDEKIRLCECVTEAGADYIKTSTGFGTAGARLEDVRLFSEHIGENVKIKAAGGIRSLKDMEAFAEAGCSRIGSSTPIDKL